MPRSYRQRSKASSAGSCSAGRGRLQPATTSSLSAKVHLAANAEHLTEDELKASRKARQ
jgi:hypothetical protein